MRSKSAYSECDIEAALKSNAEPLDVYAWRSCQRQDEYLSLWARWFRYHEGTGETPDGDGASYSLR